MDLKYKMFVEQLRRELLLATGLKADRIFYVPGGGKLSSDGDRLFIVCAQAEEAREVCGLFLGELYQCFLDGVSLDEILQRILKELEKIATSGFYEKTRRLADYSLAKEDLFIRLLNYENNKKDLQYAVYYRLGDIALVLYMKVAERDGCITSIKIRKDHVEKWGEDERRVFKEALKNTYRISPPRAYRWEQMFYDEKYQGDDFMKEDTNFHLNTAPVGNCISTLTRTNGAVAIFLPGVAEKISEELGQDLYLAFTSIHEVMVHGANIVDEEEIRDVLRETIDEATPESDYLTSGLYLYSRKQKKFKFLG